MFLLRTLAFVALIVLLFYWLRRARAKTPERNSTSTQGLLRCTFCAVNFPASEAVTVDRDVYCCEAHSLAAQKSREQR